MEVVWRYPMHQRVAAVAFSKTTAFAALAQSRLVAVATEDGSERWRTLVPHTWGWLALSRDRVLYLAEESRLEAFDAADGERQWSRVLGGTQGWLHAGEGRIVVGGWRGYTDIRCLSEEDGSILWEYPATGANLHSTTVFNGGSQLLIADAEHSCLRFLNMSTGREDETLEIEPIWFHDQRDRIIVSSSGSWNGLPQAVHLWDRGNRLLRVSVAPLRVAVIRLPDEPLTVAAPTHSCLAFVGAGRKLWTRPIQSAQWTEHGPIAHFNGPLTAVDLDDYQVLAGTSEGFLYKFDASGQANPEKLRVGKRISNPIGLSGGCLSVATDSGELLGIRVGAERATQHEAGAAEPSARGSA